MKGFLVVIIALIGQLTTQAQSLTPFVVGTAGAAFESANGTLSWTIGEVVNGTYKTTNYLTQGFHQPTTILITGIHSEEDESLVVYPNPVRDILHVQASEVAQYHIELFDLQGQRLVDELASLDNRRAHRIEVLDIPVALYILRITNSSSGAVHYHKIEKH